MIVLNKSEEDVLTGKLLSVLTEGCEIGAESVAPNGVSNDREDVKVESLVPQEPRSLLF